MLATVVWRGWWSFRYTKSCIRSLTFTGQRGDIARHFFLNDYYYYYGLFFRITCHTNHSTIPQRRTLSAKYALHGCQRRTEEDVGELTCCSAIVCCSNTRHPSTQAHAQLMIVAEVHILNISGLTHTHLAFVEDLVISTGMF